MEGRVNLKISTMDRRVSIAKGIRPAKDLDKACSSKMGKKLWGKVGPTNYCTLTSKYPIHRRVIGLGGGKRIVITRLLSRVEEKTFSFNDLTLFEAQVSCGIANGFIVSG